MLPKQLVATLSLLIVTAQSFPTQQFEQPLSTWHSLIHGIVHEACHDEYAIYKTGKDNDNGVNTTRYDQTRNVINCILAQISEYRKATMAASAVVLGSAPMVLQTIGSTTAETAMLGLRRPFLATLLAAGSPAVATTQGNQFIDVLSKFVVHRAGNEADAADINLLVFNWSHDYSSLRYIVAICQYLLAGAAVANVAHLAYQLGVHAIVAFAPNITLLPPLWTFLAIVIHIGGIGAFHSRVRVRRKPQDQGALSRWLLDEVVPLALQDPVHLEWRSEHVWFYGLTWFLKIITTGQILFGTLLLSSLLFFTVRDATLVIGRYAASAIICRAIVHFELAGLKEVTLSHKRDRKGPSESTTIDMERGPLKGETSL